MAHGIHRCLRCWTRDSFPGLVITIPQHHSNMYKPLHLFVKGDQDQEGVTNIAIMLTGCYGGCELRVASGNDTGDRAGVQ